MDSLRKGGNDAGCTPPTAGPAVGSGVGIGWTLPATVTGCALLDRVLSRGDTVVLSSRSTALESWTDQHDLDNNATQICPGISVIDTNMSESTG